MHHSRARRFTFYLVTASPDEDWFPSLLERVGVVGDSVLQPEDDLEALACSPFMMHAIISTIAFEQSTEYVADVRNRLMTQV